MTLSGPRSTTRWTALLTSVAALAATLLVGTAAPSTAAPDPARKASGSAPGSFTGYAFDTCSAPAQEVMDAWWDESPYAAVGIYLGGTNRLCDQPQLTPGWVSAQRQQGWRLLSLWVGPQAACTTYADKMSFDIPTARAQGQAQAAAAVAVAQSLGIGGGSTLYYDLEDYDITSTPCRQASLGFLGGWTEGLHAAGYSSGVYSNIAAGIAALDLADRVSNGSYAMPDEIWYAWANNHADTVTDERVLSPRWDDHARVHQYLLDTPQSFGGYPLTVDANWADVGEGSVAKPAKQLCRGVEVDLRRYPNLRIGKRGPVVSAAQCVLRKQRITKAPITGRYDVRTVAAVKKAQRKFGLKPTGRLTAPTWAALLAKGKHPDLKVGSTGEPVLRLQRSLTAALGRKTVIDGVYSVDTARRVTKLQRKRGLTVTGVVTDEVWDELSGK